MAVEIETEVPSSIDLDRAAALMTAADRSDDPEHEAETAAEDEQPEDRVEAAEDAAPEFWSADDKAAWQDVPEHMRPVLHKYEQQRIAFVNEKTRDAAKAREEAAKFARHAGGALEQAVAWWRQNGPSMQRALANKWSQVDWNKLATENPAEWARLRQQRDNEGALMAEAVRRGHADAAVATERGRQNFLEARDGEHAKLAARMPDHFGPERARQTYDELGKFLSSKGISTGRINAIYEAPIIELALAAMRFEQAQTKASSVTGRPGTVNTAVKTTSTRVVPGPAATAGNRNADAARQAGERFRKGGGTSIADAAELIRLSGL
jgi:hypothetical protein